MKKLNFAFDWIGPCGPTRNGEIPDITDLFMSHRGWISNNPQKRLGCPVIHRMFVDDNHIPCNIYSSYNLSDQKFLYELSTNECPKFIDYFDDGINGFISYNNNKFVSENVRKRVKEKKGYYVISNPFESFMEDNLLMKIHQYFNNQRIPLSQVIYATCSPNGTEIYNSFCKRHNIVPEMRCEFLPIYASNLKRETRRGLKYNPGPRNKDFLCFNRRYRDHRIMFGLMLEKYNLLDKFYFSLNKVRPESGTDFLNCVIEDRYLEVDPRLGLTQEIVNSLYKKLPLILDTTDFNGLNSTLVNDAISNLYNTSLVHIISETNFFTPVIHQTEKTIKPISNLQPFIMLGSPNSLKSIKDMGFKTFSRFWDESYDTEYDNNVRLLKITELCKTISEWSPQRKIDFTFEVKEIVDYNYNQFMNGRLLELDRWIDKYGN